jgi:hypothetical protein
MFNRLHFILNILHLVPSRIANSFIYRRAEYLYMFSCIVQFKKLNYILFECVIEIELKLYELYHILRPFIDIDYMKLLKLSFFSHFYLITNKFLILSMYNFETWRKVSSSPCVRTVLLQIKLIIRNELKLSG